jgi:disulfide bond formation protein DsbB
VIDWSFLGVTLPGWTLVVFLGLGAVALWQLLRRD